MRRKYDDQSELEGKEGIQSDIRKTLALSTPAVAVFGAEALRRKLKTCQRGLESSEKRPLVSSQFTIVNGSRKPVRFWIVAVQ